MKTGERTICFYREGYKKVIDTAGQNVCVFGVKEERNNLLIFFFSCCRSQVSQLV